MAISFLENASLNVSTTHPKEHCVNLQDATLLQCCDAYMLYRRKKNSLFTLSVYNNLVKFELKYVNGKLFPIDVNEFFLKAFIRKMQLEERLRKGTITHYCRQLSLCIKWASKHKAEISFDFDKFDLYKT